MDLKKTLSVKMIAFTGLMAAVVFVANYLRIPIPVPGTQMTGIHLGNIPCVLSGLLLGPIYGGLAAGLGGFFFDALGVYGVVSGFWTFIFKFGLAFVCGLIAYWGKREAKNHRYNIIAAVSGSLTYIVLYVGKGVFEDKFMNLMIDEQIIANIITKLTTSAINAAGAILVAVPLYYAVMRALGMAGFKLHGEPLRRERSTRQ